MTINTLHHTRELPTDLKNILDGEEEKLLNIASDKPTSYNFGSIEEHVGKFDDEEYIPEYFFDVKQRFENRVPWKDDSRYVSGMRPECSWSFDYWPNLKSTGKYHNKEDYEYFMNFRIKLNKLLGTWENALACYYPPGGFICWHNNSDTHGPNYLMTWSETGEGFFDVMKTKKDGTYQKVRIKDNPGWQLKAMYFGNEKDSICWHAAATNCKRISIAFTTNPLIQEDVIEDMKELDSYSTF